MLFVTALNKIAPITILFGPNGPILSPEDIPIDANEFLNVFQIRTDNNRLYTPLEAAIS